MKISDVKIGGTVYFKKYSITFCDPDKPLIVQGIEERNGKHNRIILDGFKANPGELTDVPCSQMTCKNCKYH